MDALAHSPPGQHPQLFGSLWAKTVARIQGNTMHIVARYAFRPVLCAACYSQCYHELQILLSAVFLPEGGGKTQCNGDDTREVVAGISKLLEGQEAIPFPISVGVLGFFFFFLRRFIEGQSWRFEPQDSKEQNSILLQKHGHQTVWWIRSTPGQCKTTPNMKHGWQRTAGLPLKQKKRGSQRCVFAQYAWLIILIDQNDMFWHFRREWGCWSQTINAFCVSIWAHRCLFSEHEYLCVCKLFSTVF